MRFVGPGLLIGRTLIVADLHLGLEDRHDRTDGLFSRPDAVLGSVERLVGSSGAERVVFNGDVLDDFALSRLESRIALGRLIRSFAARVPTVLIRGNHDPQLASLRVAAPLLDSILIGDSLVTHGDRDLVSVASHKDLRSCVRIVIGHEHPAFTLSDGIRSERFKCFVRIPSVQTPVGAREVIVLPTAHPDLVGSDVSSWRSPIIDGAHREAEIFAMDDPVRSFGTIEDLMRMEPDDGFSHS